MRFRSIVLAAGCVVVAACRMPGADPSTTQTSDHAAVVVDCPDGKQARSGLTNFGAYIGTWQANHRQVAQSKADYTVSTVPGRITARCSPAGYVVQEEIHLTFAIPAGRGVQLALTELPADAARVYDHEHSGCRTLQYRSQHLAQQLGAVDRDGLADIALESDGGTYSATSVSLVLIDLSDPIGADSRACA